MEQVDFFTIDTHNSKPELVILKNGEYIYIPNFFNKKESNLYLTLLLKEIDWKQEEMNMYGKTLKFPRLTAWYGDINKLYSFSGITLKPIIWTKEILDIKNKIKQEYSFIFNSVLLNLYRNGNDSISWHTDAEKELGINPIVASVTFGAKRKFQLKHKVTKEKIEIELEHGSLLIMQGELQHYWQHQIPKTKKIVGSRINLTFRTIK